MADDQFQLGNGNWWDSTRTSQGFYTGSSSSSMPSLNPTSNTVGSFGWPTTHIGAASTNSSNSINSSASDHVLTDSNLETLSLGLSSQGMDLWNQSLSFQRDSYNNVTCPTSFRIDSSFIHEYPNNPSNFLQRLMEYDINQPHLQSTTFDNRSISNYTYQSSSYGMNLPSSENHLHHQPSLLQPNSWTRPQNQLNFSNKAPFWNASTPAATNHDDQSNLFPLDEKRKKISEVRDLGTVAKKRSNSEASTKRPRVETPPPLPASKGKKEKMGDRITALQQLVSPFGKTDTASVLSEAIEYINFLHDRVSDLSNPYMKRGTPIQQEQNRDQSNSEGPKQDLRSRGLCLIPVSSNFPISHEATVDFWNPTFGGTFS